VKVKALRPDSATVLVVDPVQVAASAFAAAQTSDAVRGSHVFVVEKVQKPAPSHVARSPLFPVAPHVAAEVVGKHVLGPAPAAVNVQCPNAEHAAAEAVPPAQPVELGAQVFVPAVKAQAPAEEHATLFSFPRRQTLVGLV
jgi:hypothetical protein